MDANKAVQVQTQVRVNGDLVPALPFNTIDEVYFDAGKDILLREKLTKIDLEIDEVKKDQTKVTEIVEKVEKYVDKVEHNISGSGGNLSQGVEEVKNLVDGSKDLMNEAFESANKVSSGSEELKKLVDKHSNEVIDGNEEGVHGFRVMNATLQYDNEGIWTDVKTGGDDIELIKQSLAGNIPLNPFTITKLTSDVTGGIYRDGLYYL